MQGKKAIIIGATSGIGFELAKLLSQKGYDVGIAGRRLQLLEKLKNELPSKTFLKQIDVTTPEARQLLEELIAEMGGVDIVVISSGIGYINPALSWDQEMETVDVNVTGFMAMSNVAIKHFIGKGSGHLAGISSIAALRGDGDNPAYNASKAFVSNYLEGLRKKVVKSGLSITVTDIQPGYVDTNMAKGEGLFWVASPQKAAGQIFDAILKKKKHAYITRRWRIIAWAVKMIPDFIYHRI